MPTVYNVRYCTFRQPSHLFSPYPSSFFSLLSEVFFFSLPSNDVPSILHPSTFWHHVVSLSMRLSNYFNPREVDCLLLAASTSRRIFHRIRLLKVFNFLTHFEAASRRRRPIPPRHRAHPLSTIQFIYSDLNFKFSSNLLLFSWRTYCVSCLFSVSNFFEIL